MDTNLLPQVEEKIITLRNQQVILSNHVAELYGVETREINQAVRNNPGKFQEGHIFELDKQEVNSLRSKILTLKNGGRGQHSKYTPKAFTEKGLYMLASSNSTSPCSNSGIRYTAKKRSDSALQAHVDSTAISPAPPHAARSSYLRASIREIRVYSRSPSPCETNRSSSIVMSPNCTVYRPKRLTKP